MAARFRKVLPYHPFKCSNRNKIIAFFEMGFSRLINLSIERELGPLLVYIQNTNFQEVLTLNKI